MELADRICDQVKSLPEDMQREVLDFLEHLTQGLRGEDAAWSLLSFKAAMRGLEEETWPEYGDNDFVEKWQ